MQAGDCRAPAQPRWRPAADPPAGGGDLSPTLTGQLSVKAVDTVRSMRYWPSIEVTTSLDLAPNLTRRRPSQVAGTQVAGTQVVGTPAVSTAESRCQLIGTAGTHHTGIEERGEHLPGCRWRTARRSGVARTRCQVAQPSRPTVL